LRDAGQLAILKKRQLVKLTLITGQIIFIAAVIELVLEQHARGSHITNWVDALYWSATKVATVASQYAPVTTGGEIVTILLVLYAVPVAAGAPARSALAPARRRPPAGAAYASWRSPLFLW
jgi:hypothetical protein